MKSVPETKAVVNVILYLLYIMYELVPVSYVNGNYMAAGRESFVSFTHFISKSDFEKKGELLNVASTNSNPNIRYQKGTVNSKASFPNTLYVPYPFNHWYRKKLSMCCNEFPGTIFTTVSSFYMLHNYRTSRTEN